MRAPLPTFLLLFFLLPTLLIASAQEEGTMLHMIDHKYTPDPLNVTAGETIILMNFGPSDQSLPREQWGEFVHSVTAVDGSFDVQRIPPDFQAYPMQAPATPGEYPYYCRYHGDAEGNGMAGVLVVSEASAAPTPSPTASPAPSAKNESPAGWMGALVVLVAVALLSRR